MMHLHQLPLMAGINWNLICVGQTRVVSIGKRQPSLSHMARATAAGPARRRVCLNEMVLMRACHRLDPAVDIQLCHESLDVVAHGGHADMQLA